MRNNTATLDCVKRHITFCFNNETFTVDINEGDIEDSWNSITDKNGVVWDVNFAWEDSKYVPKPSFTVYTLDKDEDTGLYSTNTSNYTSIKIGKTTLADKDVFFKEARFKYKFDVESPLIARIYNSKDVEIHKTRSFNRACDELHFAKKEDTKSYMVIQAISNNSTKRID